jgi:hypothetical protein
MVKRKEARNSSARLYVAMDSTACESTHDGAACSVYAGHGHVLGPRSLSRCSQFVEGQICSDEGVLDVSKQGSFVGR